MVRSSGRAALPDRTGSVERDGVPLVYDVYGNGGPTVLLMPTWSIVHSRVWKAQVAYLARHYRVVTFDGRGNGRSGRPAGPAAYADEEFAADTLAVMDATGTAQAVLVALSCGATVGRPRRGRPPRPGARPVRHRAGGAGSRRATAVGSGSPGTASTTTTRAGRSTTGATGSMAGSTTSGTSSSASMFTEPHSTKQIEDAAGLGRRRSNRRPWSTHRRTAGPPTPSPLEPICAGVQCPVTVVHGTDDRIRSVPGAASGSPS